MEKLTVNGYVCEVRHSGAHKTKKYLECLKVLEEMHIKQVSIEDAIRFVLNYGKVPQKAIESITEFRAYLEDRILMIRCSRSQELFDARIDIAKEIGWYPFVTGVELSRSRISDFVNRHIRQRRRLKLEKSTFGPIKFLPVSTSPNHESFLLKLGETQILLDAGIRSDDFDAINPRDIDVVFVSHSHFDHTSSLLPLYLSGCKAPIVATATTIDFLIATLGMEKAKSLLDHLVPAMYGERIEIGTDTYITLINAGHIPGSAMALITAMNRRILYTGDFSLRDHFPVKGSANEINLLGKIDIAIMDCSFADTTFGPDADFYATLHKECLRTLELKGNVLIAADPEVMSQNLFLSLQHSFAKDTTIDAHKPPVYIEQKAIEYMQIVRSRLQDLPREFQFRLQRGVDPFASVMRKTMLDSGDRDEALSGISIIVSGPPHDLSSFPISYFLPRICRDAKNLLVLTGFGGRTMAEELAKERKIRLPSRTVEVKCKIFNFEHPELILAFHCDYRQLELTLATLKPEKLIPFHGAPPSIWRAALLSKKYYAEPCLPRKKIETCLN